MPRTILPGFRLAMGCTLVYVGVIVLLPLAALVWQAADLGWARFVTVVTGERALAAFRVTVLAALGATAINAVFGLALAWALVRYDFPGKRLLDALVDVPFALPTAVAGVALTALFAGNGWYGQLLEPFGIKVAYAPLGIVAAMTFTSLPFVVRSVQPVLEDLTADVEEAAETLGAGQARIFASVIFPSIFPAFLAGCSLAFARSLGEFGAVIFIAGNQPFRTEIAALLVFIRLEEYDYPAAAAIASVMLGAAFLMLLAVNAIQLWSLRWTRSAS
ncbi:sulfate transport system permease protein [Methylopila capsulata]|uniref:Sulfate transport system permease protein CysT n=1 Tax=Methylopila capsulata TaxID=61654 RepID=A0A9W6MTA3_9HYPH|nr:sulfate ABC transporter permease subunit CysT [Methylopila capsulata]MBM7852848.1 sulfate transport system permease protein [Methylopila capsulata]GLK57057.1 ABC transporter permease [Methylopila capsulata]